MILNTRFITDEKGNRISAILPIEVFEQLLLKLDDLEYLRLYDKAMEEDDGERISFDDYLEQRNKDNG